MITALTMKPGEHPCITFLCDDSNYLDCAVSIESEWICSAAALKIEDGLAAIYNDDGAVIGLPGNRRIGTRIIAGSFYIVRVKNGKLISLTDEDISRFTLLYWEPQDYTDDEVLDSYFSETYS